MILTFIILAITIALFVWNKIPADVVALLSLLALLLTGTLTTQQALSGFSDSSVIMIAGLFVVGEGLSRTGITAWLADLFMQLAGSTQTRLLAVLMSGTALLSAFMSNTGTVATLLPATVSMAWRIKSVPSKLLIPLAFAASAGGLLTLIASPTNIIANETLTNAGLPPFGFFEFALIGLPLVLLLLIYMLTIGQRWLPAHTPDEHPFDMAAALGEATDAFALSDNLFWLRVRQDSSLVGQTLAQSGLRRDFEVSVLSLKQLETGSTRRRLREFVAEFKSSPESPLPAANTQFQANDMLLVQGSPEAVQRAAIHFNLGLQPPESETDDLNQTLLSQEVGLAVILPAPRSIYLGQTMTEAQIAEKFRVQVIGIWRNNLTMPLASTQLQLGDALLVRGDWTDIVRLRNESQNFVVMGSPETMARQMTRLNARSVIAGAALLLMIGLMLFDVTPAVTATLIAALMMVLGGCLSTAEAYRAINWSSVVLLAAMIPMSIALEVTGGAQYIADLMVQTFGAIGPMAMLAGIFLLTAAFSQVISNTATVVLVAPIALNAALSLGISPQAMMMMVVVGASAAFLTPFASPVNTLVLAPGNYRFNDFAKVGALLVLLFMVVSLILVPLIWG